MKMSFKTLLKARDFDRVLDLTLEAMPGWEILDSEKGDIGSSWALITRGGEEFPENGALVCAHTDTVWSKAVDVVENKGVFRSKRPGTGIGGDDRCGIWVAAKALPRSDGPVALALFDGEEIGALGSRSFVEARPDIRPGFLIGLDRRGFQEVVYYGNATSAFKKAVSGALADHSEGMGSFSDVSHMAPAMGVCCVNLSVGFHEEHTPSEYAVMADMEEAADSLTVLLDMLAGERFPLGRYRTFKGRNMALITCFLDKNRGF